MSQVAKDAIQRLQEIIEELQALAMYPMVSVPNKRRSLGEIALDLTYTKRTLEQELRCVACRASLPSGELNAPPLRGNTLAP